MNVGAYAPHVVSPVTGGSAVSVVRRVPSAWLKQIWMEGYGIDVSDYFRGMDAIWLYQCDQSGVQFFAPSSVSGAASLYERLEQEPLYYVPRKWEHDVALSDMKSAGRVLEVGCGRGDFVERARRDAGLDARGIELNPHAVTAAQQRGIPVTNQELQALANQEPESVDVICSFQVLEHVPETGSFLRAALTLLKPRGRLILSVPNRDAFARHDPKDVLDHPPHHVTRWSEECFHRLTHLFPLKVHQVRREPLAPYHVDWFVNVQANRAPAVWPVRSLWFRGCYGGLRPVLNRFAKIRERVVGHTLYVCFDKTG